MMSLLLGLKYNSIELPQVSNKNSHKKGVPLPQHNKLWKQKFAKQLESDF